jgi:hypothetical protein
MRYQVVFKGVADNSAAGIQSFLERFGQAYRMSPDRAKDWIREARGLIYSFDDLAAAEKSKKFLEAMGALAEIKVEGGPGIGEPVTAPAERPCPKCASPVPNGRDDCPVCHIHISKYEKRMAAVPAKKSPSPMPVQKAPSLKIPEAPLMADLDPIQPAPPPSPAQPPAGAGDYQYGIESEGIPLPGVILPEARNSLIYGIVGLFVLLGIVLGPLALYTGIKALEIIKLNPGIKGKPLAIAGIILGSSEIIGLVFGILLARGILFF